MTRKEAISIMNVIIHMIEPQYDTDRIEHAVELAIKALEHKPYTDAISRQAMQTELKNCEVVEARDEDDDLVGYYNADTVDSIVRNLPPVTAEKPNKSEIPIGWIPVSVIENIKSEINELSELDHIEPTYEDCKRDVMDILGKYKASPTGEVE